MSVALASAWNPRGELGRFQHLYKTLRAEYCAMVVTLPPDADAEVEAALKALPGVQPVVTPEWPAGRYLALQGALETQAGHVNYADFDRLLRWVETRSEEWRHTVRRIQQSDCLVIGRTEAAWATHPRALIETEAISNRVFSDLLGIELDLSAGSKGFSRAAAAVIVANTQPRHALGADSEWVMIAHRAGFAVETLLVDGLDWETADRHQAAAADAARQRQAAQRYDEDAQNWSMRVAVAAEVVAAGLDATRRELKGGD